MHEIMHRLGVDSEKEAGLLQAEFCSNMAENYKGTKHEAIYRAAAKEGMDYAQRDSKISVWDISSKKASPLEQIIAKFYADGKELGLEGKKLRDYVSKRAKETYGELLTDEYYEKSEEHEKEAKSSKSRNSSGSKKEMLEEIINEGDDVSNQPSESTGTSKGKRGKEKANPSSTDWIIRHGTDYKHDADENTYESIEKSEYRSMSDAKKAVIEDKESKSERAVANAETAEASAEN